MNALETLPRVLRADDEAIVAGRVRLALEVRFEQLLASATSFGFFVITPKLRLFSMSRPREVVAVDVQHAPVDDHHLAVIANQVVRGARDGDAALEELHLELPQALRPAAVLVRRQRADVDAAGYRLLAARWLSPGGPA